MIALVVFDGSIATLTSLQIAVVDSLRVRKVPPKLYYAYFECIAPDENLENDLTGLKEKARKLQELARQKLLDSGIAEVEGEFFRCYPEDIPQILTELAEENNVDAIYLAESTPEEPGRKQFLQKRFPVEPAPATAIPPVPFISYTTLIKLTSCQVILTRPDGEVIRFSYLPGDRSTTRKITPARQKAVLGKSYTELKLQVYQRGATRIPSILYVPN